MKTDATQSWLKFLNPVELKQNLIRCSIFIAAWELLKESVIDPILWFYTDGFHGKTYIRPKYHQEVIDLDTREKKDVFHASCLWLRKNNAICDADIQMISYIRDHRNFVTHEMTKVLGAAGVEVNLGLLDNLIDILCKIDRWWIVEVEIPTNPDFTAEDMEKVDRTKVFSMRMMTLQLIAMVAHGDDQSLMAIYEEFREKTRSTEQQAGG